MKLQKHEIQAVLEEAAALFNSGDYPFSAEVDGSRLLCRVTWKDAALLGLGTVSREVSTFRYIVELKEDGTFHGYDMDADMAANFDMHGHMRVSGSAFVGHEFRLHKEFGVDAEEGIRTYGFNTAKIHKPVKEFFTGKGFTYRDPDLQMVALEGGALTVYKTLGVLFTLIGVSGIALFLSIGVWPAAFIPGIFAALGLWALGVGAGKAWMPLFSPKMVVKITIGTFAASWGIILLVLGLIALAGGIG